ncbi:uncharacterized protein [Acropora muricata]|uniref:uncharacterized protein isoform X2 n=1 Tax=Acropora muricata TaxID=159855 RepID=UPI0034E3B1CE
MPVCAICESVNFDSIDGLYFCHGCGTQSQDVRDEDADEQYGDTAPNLQVSKKGKRGQKKRFFADKGKPWFMYEAYQLVMKAQVEFLVGRGVNPALKDVVFKLWYKYLQVTGCAFTGKCVGTSQFKSTIFYCRDAELLGVDKRKKRQKETIEEDDSEDLELSSHVSDGECHEGCDSLKAQPENTSIEADDVNSKEESLVDEGNAGSSDDEFVGSISVKQSKYVKPSNSRSRIRSGHASLQLTLVFCYLGLLWIDEPVFLSDIIRWAKQGEFPYFQATRYLPSYMKFGYEDFSCLCPKREQETIAKKQISDKKSGATIPLFTDWLKCWKRCEAKKFEKGIPWTDEQSQLLRNPSVYASFCRSDIFGSWKPTDEAYTGIEAKNYRINRTTNEESQERYAQLFKSLMGREKEQELSSVNRPLVTSFPGACAHVTQKTAERGSSDTCLHEMDVGVGAEESCFSNLRFCRVDVVEVLENSKDAKYFSYLENGQSQETFHSSYKTLLNILADRIEVTADDLQKKVRKIESALFCRLGAPRLRL